MPFVLNSQGNSILDAFLYRLERDIVTRFLDCGCCLLL